MSQNPNFKLLDFNGKCTHRPAGIKDQPAEVINFEDRLIARATKRVMAGSIKERPIPEKLTPAHRANIRAHEFQRNWPNIGPFLTDLVRTRVEAGRLTEEESESLVSAVEARLAAQGSDIRDPIKDKVIAAQAELAETGFTDDGERSLIVALGVGSERHYFNLTFRDNCLSELLPKDMKRAMFEVSTQWCVNYEPVIVAVYRCVQDQVSASFNKRKSPSSW